MLTSSNRIIFILKQPLPSYQIQAKYLLYFCNTLLHTFYNTPNQVIKWFYGLFFKDIVIYRHNDDYDDSERQKLYNSIKLLILFDSVLFIFVIP